MMAMNVENIDDDSVPESAGDFDAVPLLVTVDQAGRYQVHSNWSAAEVVTGLQRVVDALQAEIDNQTPPEEGP